MNSAGLRRPEHFDKYFELLENEETDLVVILKELYRIPRQKGDHALFLSFATKLIHTVDNTFPIYDNNISTILNLPRVKYDNLSLEQKINQRIEIYEELKNNFSELLADEEILSLLNRFRNKFEQFNRENSNFEWEDELINDVKLLDSVLWASYQLSRSFKVKVNK